MSQIITQLSQTLATQLTLHQKTVATAESCTGGGIGACLTDLAGSSAWFMGGIISYSNRAKTQLLAVADSLLQAHGAVSEPVVQQMAKAALHSFNTDYAVAVSGVAGPAGGTNEKPVGTVWVAWAAQDRWEEPPNTVVRQQKYHFLGGRHAIRQQTIAAAIEGLLEHLKDA